MERLIDAPGAVREAQEVVTRALSRVEDRFESALRSDLPAVQGLLEHLETYRGKMLRPALVIGCGLATLPLQAGGATAESVSDEHVTIAAVCEMVHMATLVHDDVLDGADLRRRGSTINRLRGNEMAVILGDYLFSAAYRLCATLESQQAALLIGQTGMSLCAGELLQLHHRDDWSLDEPTYFEIVRRKTGSLIAVSCRLGAMQSGAGPEWCERFSQIGLDLGVAFQIQDDLLDLTGDARVVGKPLLRDVELGKLTLPLIHHLNSARPAERGETLRLIGGGGPLDADAARELLAALDSTGSIQHSRATAHELVARTQATLADLPESSAKSLLLEMAAQVVERCA